MYEFLRGVLTGLNPANVVIDISGVGYFIHISLNTYSRLNGKTEAKLLIHQVVREDAHILYGFADQRERELFRQLISVSGVGAGTALMMLSSLNPDEIVAAVTTGNADQLKAIKGIGTKTAQRIIIDLRDKLGKTGEGDQFLVSTNNTLQNESLSALVMLGFAKKDADKVVVKIIKENPEATLEHVIKTALKRL